MFRNNFLLAVGGMVVLIIDWGYLSKNDII